MTQEYREAEHFLSLSVNDGETDITLLHPEGCPTGDIGHGMHGHICGISHHLNEFGLDLHLADVEPGMYLATFWATPPRWAGPVPIDADDGIELTQLAPVGAA